MPKKQLIKKGSGYLIILCDGRHFSVDTAMQPSEHDHIDTGLGGLSLDVSYTSSCGLWWGVARDEASGFVIESPSYHHQRFPGNCQLEFERCPKFLSILAGGSSGSSCPLAGGDSLELPEEDSLDVCYPNYSESILSSQPSYSDATRDE